MKTMIYDVISAFVKSFSKTTISIKEINGSKMKLHYEKAQHLTFLFKRKISYENHLQNKVKKYVNSGDLVFDIGGNIGQYALPFSQMVGDSGRVISFEPDYNNFAFLQFNVNINQCSNVHCINAGLGDNDSHLEFFRDTETGGRSGSFKKEFVGEHYKGFSDTVSLRKFDTLLAEFGIPDFVKIDVEGFEEDVLSGLSQKLDKTIFFIEVREETKVKIFNYFHRRGYECLWIDGNDHLIKDPNTIPRFANLIFKKT